LIEDCLNWQEGRIDRMVKRTQQYIEDNTMEWVVSVKDLFLNTFRNVIFPLITEMIWKQPRQEPVVEPKKDEQKDE
jgi:hypothetical protein